MIGKLLKLSLVCATGAIIFTANPKTAMAYEEGVAGFVYDKDSSSTGSNADGATIVSFSVSEIPIPGFINIGIANVDTNLLIRKGPGEDYKILGKLPKDGGCEIIEDSTDGWTKISATTSSGDLTGYVKSEYLITGSEATRRAKEVGNYVATANVDGLNIRGEASTDAPVLDQMAKGEELVVLDSKVITDDADHSEWVKVSVDSDTQEVEEAYVAKEFVELSFQLIHAVTIEEIQYGIGVSQTRINLVNEAKEHLGEAYVWGGTRLGKGVDCSGFTQALYRSIGIYIPRTSGSQGSSGTSVSASELKPGDLVFYGGSGGINHVAMYIGNGKIIHASNKRDGIKISNMYYRSPKRFRRYISD
jgi:peptidoglycan DL-endopeptidase CwlO